MRKYRIIENYLDNETSEYSPQYQDDIPKDKNTFSLELFQDWEPLLYEVVPTLEDAMEIVNLDKRLHVGIKGTTIHKLYEEETKNIRNLPTF
jgi:hypothetical protein